MPPDNVELVRFRAEAFSVGDLETALEIVAPGAELELADSASPEHHVYRDVTGFRAGIRRWIGGWESYRPSMDRYLAAGEDVVILVTETGVDPGAPRSRPPDSTRGWPPSAPARLAGPGPDGRPGGRREAYAASVIGTASAASRPGPAAYADA